MQLEALSEIGKVAGIAGICVVVLMLTFRSVITKKIFPTLTKEQGYRLFRMILVSVSLVCFVGIAAWVYTEVASKQEIARQKLDSVFVTGLVQDVNGASIQNVAVEIEEYPDLGARTDRNGKYAIKLTGKQRQFVNLIFRHKDYRSIRENIEVPFGDKAEIEIAQVQMNFRKPKQALDDDEFESTPRHAASNKSNPIQDSKIVPATSGEQEFGMESGLQDIEIYYVDDVGCDMELAISIDGDVLRLAGGMAEGFDFVAGNYPYSISGTIWSNLDGTSCYASGTGQIAIHENSTAFLVVFNTATCVVSLVPYA